jgi:hypothetical protein
LLAAAMGINGGRWWEASSEINNIYKARKLGRVQRLELTRLLANVCG